MDIVVDDLEETAVELQKILAAVEKVAKILM